MFFASGALMKIPLKDHLVRVEHAGQRLFAIVDDVQLDRTFAGAYLVAVTLAPRDITGSDDCYWVTDAGERLAAPIQSVRTTRVTKLTLRAFED